MLSLQVCIWAVARRESPGRAFAERDRTEEQGDCENDPGSRSDAPPEAPRERSFSAPEPHGGLDGRMLRGDDALHPRWAHWHRAGDGILVCATRKLADFPRSRGGRVRGRVRRRRRHLIRLLPGERQRGSSLSRRSGRSKRRFGISKCGSRQGERCFSHSLLPVM
jgi:hypothetical protein